MKILEPALAYKLTAEYRRRVCVHEAAHAVVFALNRYCFVHFVEVAPIGATKEWASTSRKGATLTDLWGLCAPSDNPIALYLRWDDQDGSYVANLALYRQASAMVAAALPEARRRAARAAWSRTLRAHICGTMAGPIGEGLFAGEIARGSIAAGEHWIEPESWNPGHDTAIAAASCWFLPYRNEYQHLCAVTERELMEPGIWASVMRLADALESAGRLEDKALDALLPAPRSNWPPSPRRPVVAPTVSGKCR